MPSVLSGPPRKTSILSKDARNHVGTSPTSRHSRAKGQPLEEVEPLVEVEPANIPSGVVGVRLDNGASALALEQWRRAEVSSLQHHANAAEWQTYAEALGENYEAQAAQQTMLQHQAAACGVAVRAGGRIATKKFRKLKHDDKARFRRMTRTR